MISTFIQDARQALRNIRNAPIFFGALILTIAIGIGANTAIFSIIKTVLLDPLPYPGSDRILITSGNPWVPVEIYEDLKASAGGSFEEVAAFYSEPVAITGGDEPVEVEGARVTPNFFRIFGAKMAHGPGFARGENTADSDGTAVVSQGLWQYRLGRQGDPTSQTIQISGTPRQIVGMVDREFRQITPGTKGPLVWVVSKFESERDDGEKNWVIPIVRVKEGVSLSRAQAEMKVVVERFMDRNPDFRGPRWVNMQLVPMKDELVGNLRPTLLILQFAVGLLLLIACVNIANLLQARFTSRQREFAIRESIGASKHRLMRQLLTESVVLALIGGLAGFLLMLVSLKLIVSMAPQDIPRIDQVSGDPILFLFSLGISLVAGLLFGVFPATVATRRSLHDHLKEGGRSPSRSKGQQRVNQVLVVAEIMLTLILLVGAGLLLRTLFALTSLDLGYRTDNVYVLPVNIPENRYASVPELERFYQQARESIAAVPGVEQVGVSNNLPIRRGRSAREVQVEGLTDIGVFDYGVVSPGFYEALNIPIVRGRDIADSDRRGMPPVAIVDQSMADGLWSGDAIGKRFRMGENDWITVVGVVGNSRSNGLINPSRPGFYISNQQRLENLGELSVGRQAVFVIRSGVSLESLAPALRRALWAVDAQQPIPDIVPLQQVIDNEGGPQRFRATLFAAFAAIALLLVIAGIYGIVSYLVAERTHELGIRKVMGATDGDIIGRILLWGFKLALIGIVAGIGGTFALNRYLSSLLYGVGTMDPLTIAASILVIIWITAIACFIPARRVAKVDPIVALRGDGRA